MWSRRRLHAQEAAARDRPRCESRYGSLGCCEVLKQVWGEQRDGSVIVGRQGGLRKRGESGSLRDS